VCVCVFVCVCGCSYWSRRHGLQRPARDTRWARRFLATFAGRVCIRDVDAE